MAETLMAGVELGGTKCVCVLATGTGEILAQERVDTAAPDITLPQIKAVLGGWFGSGRAIDGLGLHIGQVAHADGEGAGRGAALPVGDLDHDGMALRRLVIELRPLGDGDQDVVLADGTHLTLTRSYREAFEARLGGVA